MPTYERGVYEPSDEVRVFDGAEDEDDEEGSRLPLLIVIALIVLALFGSVVWLAYERGVANGRTEPRILTAEEGPAKVPAAVPSGSDTPLTGLKIYNQPAGNEDESEKPVKSVAALPAPVAAPSKPVAAKANPVEAKATVAPKPVQPKPVTHPMQTAQATPSSPAPATAPPRALTPAPAIAAPKAQPSDALAPAPAQTSATPVAGAYVLQIGAYKSEGEASDSWDAFRQKHSALVAGFSSDVRKVDIPGKGTWYRLRLGSFADKDAATALCERLKADGGNCFLAK